MPTTINTQNTAEITAGLGTLEISAYRFGVAKLISVTNECRTAWMTFLAGSATGSITKKTATVTPTKTSTPAKGVRRRGRPPIAKETTITKGKSGVGTQDLVAYITANPGVTQATLRAVFPTMEAKVIGLRLARATRATKAHPTPLIAISGKGYYPAQAIQRQAA